MKYEVKVASDDGSGKLTYGSLAELKSLFEQGFVAPEDLVRQEGSDHWVRADRLPALRGAERRSRTETRMAARLSLAIGLSLVVGVAALKYKGVALAGLVLVAVALPFWVFRRRDRPKGR
ncbi:MAG: GYF domain-containing protein [Deltaproteobacteria bacterium]